GLLSAYLPTTLTRKNFKLLINTIVYYIIYISSKATSIKLKSSYYSIINLKPSSRVILSTSTFRSSKLLFYSSIRLKD
ncbi:hypothetical protein GQ44DRAFT_635513, partial [Phaeosphaeriaceae sp. PMI808]